MKTRKKEDLLFWGTIFLLWLGLALAFAFEAKAMCWVGACPPLPAPPPPAIGCSEMAPMCVCDMANCCQWHWVCVR